MPLSPRFILLALALSGPTLSALAQQAATAPPSPSGLRDRQFVLGPGDVISLTVVGIPELSASALTLSPTGRVTLPLIGALTIKDKTLEAARHAIETAYKSQLRKPNISISLVRAAARQVTVLGAVARPGAVNLQPGWRVLEVLAAAGGLDNLAPDDVAATLKPLSGPTVALDLAAIFRAPESRANPRIGAGDVMSIAPISLVNVTINGDVGAPGAQRFRRAPKLLEALARAGELKLAPADTRVSLLRDGKIVPLDVAAAAGNPAGAANLELRDGDLLSVQGVRLSVSVLSDAGLVKSSGNYQLEGRSNLTRAIEAAGGTTAPARQISATVRRGNAIIPVDLARALYDRAADISLQNNDILVLNPVEGPRVRLTGEVKAPAEYHFQKGVKIRDAVEQAGGLKLAPQATRITVLRTLPGGRQLSFQVDAARLLGDNDFSQNLELKDGDTILVSALAARSVAVTGEVENSGAYELARDEGLAQLLAKAGGPGELADLSRITIERDGQTSRTVDFSPPDKVVALEAGDRVRVPTNPRQILLMDAVNKPGIYAMNAGATLPFDAALVGAGGISANANKDEITLLRPAPDTPQSYTATRIKYDARQNLLLQPGDVVLVPDKDGPSKLAQGITALRAFDAARGYEF